MVPRENKNNAYVKFGGGQTKNIMVFSEMAYANTIHKESYPASRDPSFDLPIKIDEEEKYTTTKE